MRQWLGMTGRWLVGTLPPAEFAAMDPPDWLLELRVTCLPPGRVYTWRLRLWRERGHLAGAAYWLLPVLRATVPGAGEVPAARAAEWWDLAGQAFDEPVPQTSVRVMDGLPCRIRLCRRAPFGVVRQSWNLAAWWCPPEPLTGLPPMVRLAASVCSRSGV